MSTPFYDLASLVIQPSGVKAQKVYAQKPMTTDGQLTFSRASTATRVNASGLIETVSSNVPRLDYLGSTCPKLQLEPSRTNLVRQSNAQATSPWIDFGGTKTNNSATSPDGTNNATLFASSGATAAGVYQTNPVASGSVYTVSMYVKLGTATNVCLVMNNTQNWDTLPGNVYTTANGLSTTAWTRVSFSFTAPVSNNSNIHIGTHSQTGLAAQSLGTFYIYGVQLELGSYVSSIIPTTTAAVTRLADACSKTGISSLIGQTEGTLFLDFVAQATTTAQSHIWLGAAGSEIGVYGPSSFVFYSSGGVSINGGAFVTGQRYKIAFAYKANDYVAYVNGVQKGTDTSATVPAMSALYINSYIDFTETQKREVNQALLFKTRLTNAQLAELTTL
jgi:hypothetical protein